MSSQCQGQVRGHILSGKHPSHSAYARESSKHDAFKASPDSYKRVTSSFGSISQSCRQVLYSIPVAESASPNGSTPRGLKDVMSEPEDLCSAFNDLERRLEETESKFHSVTVEKKALVENIKSEKQ